MSPTLEVVTERAILGEGPHWDVDSQSLYYIDIFGQYIHKYTPSTNIHSKVKIGKFSFVYVKNIIFNFFYSEGGPVTLVVPVEGTTDSFLISIGRKLAVVTWDGKSATPDRVGNAKLAL